MDHNDFFDDGTDEEYYEHINRTIIDGNVMNIYLIIMEGKYGAIGTDYYSFHGYYIIKFSSSPYTLQEELIIDGQVISYGEMVYERTYLFPLDINSRYYFYKKMNTLTRLFL